MLRPPEMTSFHMKWEALSCSCLTQRLQERAELGARAVILGCWGVSWRSKPVQRLKCSSVGSGLCIPALPWMQHWGLPGPSSCREDSQMSAESLDFCSWVSCEDQAQFPFCYFSFQCQCKNKGHWSQAENDGRKSRCRISCSTCLFLLQTTG